MGRVYFSQEDADKVFDELKDLQVDLDADPLVYGPKRLNSKFAQARGMLSRCERIFLGVSQKLHRLKKMHTIESLDLELSKRHLFANDPETRAGRSVSDRDAIASGKLKEKISEVNDLAIALESLSSVLVVVKAKRSDLKDTEGRLRDQMRLCQEEIGLGSQWGSKYTGDIDLRPQQADQSSIKEMTDMLSGVDMEIDVSKLKGTWEDPEEMDSDVSIVEKDGYDEDVENLLVSTTTQNEVDAALGDLVVDAAVQSVSEKKEIVIDDTDLDKVLDFFEKD